MAITNTLIKRIQEVKSEGESFKDANFYKNKKAEIEQVFLPSFDSLCTKFEDVVTAYDNLKKIKEIDNVSIEFDLLKECLKELKDKVLKDDYDKLYVLNFRKTLDANYNLLKGAWDNYISDKTDARTEMLFTLDKLIADMPEKTLLQAKKHIFTQADIGAPNAVKAIEEYIDIYEKLINKLNLKENISAFLKKLASGERVSIKDMDDEVYKWIKASDFSNKIILKVN